MSTLEYVESTWGMLEVLWGYIGTTLGYFWSIWVNFIIFYEQMRPQCPNNCIQSRFVIVQYSSLNQNIETHLGGSETQFRSFLHL